MMVAPFLSSFYFWILKKNIMCTKINPWTKNMIYRNLHHNEQLLCILMIIVTEAVGYDLIKLYPWCF